MFVLRRARCGSGPILDRFAFAGQHGSADVEVPRPVRAGTMPPRVRGMSSRGTYVLASVSRAVRTVELVAAAGALRLAELAASLGVSRPGAFRIAQTLVAHRWLVQGEDRRYRIGPAARDLAETAEPVRDDTRGG